MDSYLDATQNCLYLLNCKNTNQPKILMLKIDILDNSI